VQSPRVRASPPLYSEETSPTFRCNIATVIADDYILGTDVLTANSPGLSQTAVAFVQKNLVAGLLLTVAVTTLASLWTGGWSEVGKIWARRRLGST